MVRQPARLASRAFGNVGRKFFRSHHRGPLDVAAQSPRSTSSDLSTLRPAVKLEGDASGKLSSEAKLPWKPWCFIGAFAVGVTMAPRMVWCCIGILACALSGQLGETLQQISASAGLGFGVSLCVTIIRQPCEITNADFAAMFGVIILLFIARSTVQAMWLKAELDSRETYLIERQYELDRQSQRLERHAKERAHEYASTAVQDARRRARNAEGIAKGLRRKFHGDRDDNVACKICFDRAASCALLPCKHLGFCRVCAEYMASAPSSQNRCPLCRAPVVGIFEGYPA